MKNTQDQLLNALGVNSINDLSFVQRILVERVINAYKTIGQCEKELESPKLAITRVDVLRDDIRAAENQLMKHLKNLGLLTDKKPIKNSLMDHFSSKRNAIQKPTTKKTKPQTADARN